MRLLLWFLSSCGEAVFCYFSTAVHITSNLHDISEHKLFSCLTTVLQPLLCFSYSSGYLRVWHYSSTSMVPALSYLLFTFPLPTTFPGPIPDEWSVLPSGNKLHSFLQVALHFSCSPSAWFSFYFFLDSSPCLQESLRREAAMQGAEERALTCRPRTLAKAAVFQWGPSEFWIVPAKSTRLPCCQPQQPCQWTPQPWSCSSLLSPLCILSAGGWHRVIATCPSSICSIQSSHQPTFKYRGDRLLRRAARVEASALSLLANSLFLKHISSCACYSSALLLKMSSSNINHESDESIYSRQACIGGNRVKERKKIDRCVL